MAAENSVNNGIPVESSKGGARLMDNGVNCLPDGTGVVLAASGDGDSAGLGSRIIRTYKRRKCGAVSLEPKLAHLENLSCNQSQNEMEKEVGCIGLQRCSCKQVCHCKKSCTSLKNGSADYLLQRWRSSLQNMFQSFSADQVGISGIESYIRDAPFNDAQVHSPKVAKAEGDSPHGQCSAQHASLPKRSVTDVGKHPALASNGSVTELNAPTVTKQCQHALFRMIMSEKFVSLCKLLSENFHPFKFDKIMDFSILESRMKQRTYEKAPALFLSDVQQLWRKLHVIGIEVVSLSKSLSEMSCPELALLSEQRDELPLQACRECGEESDGRNCVACDSCEQLFHVSCIKPSATKILYINWYCANCTALVTESYHENCVVCGRLNHSHGINEVGVSTNDESPNGDAESSDVTKKGAYKCSKAAKGFGVRYAEA